MSIITKPIEETEIEEPVVLDELDEIILKMENYIREHGWIQGEAYGPNGEVCLIGALYSIHGLTNQDLALASDTRRTSKLNRMGREIVLRVRRSGKTRNNFASLPTYNDLVAQSVEDIYHFLRIARGA